MSHPLKLDQVCTEINSVTSTDGIVLIVKNTPYDGPVIWGRTGAEYE